MPAAKRPCIRQGSLAPVVERNDQQPRGRNPCSQDSPRGAAGEHLRTVGGEISLRTAGRTMTPRANRRSGALRGRARWDLINEILDGRSRSRMTRSWRVEGPRWRTGSRDRRRTLIAHGRRGRKTTCGKLGSRDWKRVGRKVRPRRRGLTKVGAGQEAMGRHIAAQRQKAETEDLEKGLTRAAKAAEA